MAGHHGDVRELVSRDIDSVYQVINEAAKAYGSVLSPSVYHEPQMTMEELRSEIKRVKFLVYEEEGQILGVMGFEYVEDVALIRHAYVHPRVQGNGIGSMLLKHIEKAIVNSGKARRIIIGTYSKAAWAIAFYEKRGYRKSSDSQQILLRYYDIPEIQRLNSLTMEKNLTWP